MQECVSLFFLGTFCSCLTYYAFKGVIPNTQVLLCLLYYLNY